MAGETEIAYKLTISEHLGILYTKAMFKMLAIVFTAVQLFLYYPVAALVFLFFAYFTLPTFYYRTEPYKAAEAWIRMLIGIAISILLFQVFGGPLLLSNPSLSIALLGFAFFATFPRSEESPVGEKVIIVTGKRVSDFGRGAGTEFVGNLLFIF